MSQHDNLPDIVVDVPKSGVFEPDFDIETRGLESPSRRPISNDWRRGAEPGRRSACRTPTDRKASQLDYVTLGRTGLRTSVAGLGCGGASRLGQSYGASRSASIDVVRAALDLGINLIDTAAAYGTEEIVGEAIAGRRDRVIVSTKTQVVAAGGDALNGALIDTDNFVQGVEQSLKRLGSDYIDILHFHGVAPNQYAHCVTTLLPAVIRLREQGKVKFVGITERFVHDTGHEMMRTALSDDHWDVVMTGFNLLNPSAAARVLEPSRHKQAGTLIMFAVRRALSDPSTLKELIGRLIGQGLIDSGDIDLEDPLGFLVHQGGARGVVDGAYRFCRHQPGADVILTGTGSIAHLTENVAAINAGPLTQACQTRLSDLFGKIDCISGN